MCVCLYVGEVGVGGGRWKYIWMFVMWRVTNMCNDSSLVSDHLT